MQIQARDKDLARLFAGRLQSLDHGLRGVVPHHCEGIDFWMRLERSFGVSLHQRRVPARSQRVIDDVDARFVLEQLVVGPRHVDLGDRGWIASNDGVIPGRNERERGLGLEFPGVVVVAGDVIVRGRGADAPVIGDDLDALGLRFGHQFVSRIRVDSGHDQHIDALLDEALDLGLLVATLSCEN